MTADMIIALAYDNRISISLAFFFRIIYSLHPSVSCKPSRKLNIYFGGLFTELTMSSLRNLFRLLFLQTVLFDTAVKEGKFVGFIM